MPETPLGTYILTGTSQESWLAELNAAGYDKDTIVELTIEERQGEDDINYTVLRGFVQSAEKEFSFWAGQRYVLPITLSTSADFLRDIMRRRCVLWKKIQNGKLSEDQRAQAREDLDIYKKIASGDLDITVASGETAPTDEASTVGISYSQGRIFTCAPVDETEEDGASELDMM